MQSCIFKAETGENHCSIVSDDSYIKDKLEKLDHKIDCVHNSTEGKPALCIYMCIVVFKLLKKI